MFTEVSICNTALARVGSSMFISALTEASMQAQVCTLFYEQCRDRVLQAFPFKFARKTEALQLVANATLPGWEYVYSYPNDCLKTLAVCDENGVTTIVITVDSNGVVQTNLNYKISYDVAAYGTGKVIVSNTPDLYLVYTRRVENANLFDPQFASALSWLIASEIATPLAADAKYAQAATNAYKAAVSDALADSWNEGYEGKIPESEFVTVRS